MSTISGREQMREHFEEALDSALAKRDGTGLRIGGELKFRMEFR